MSRRRCKGGGGPPPKQARTVRREETPPNLKNHCFLCLQPSLEESGGSSRSLGSFQPIINYLTGTDPAHHGGRNESGGDNDSQEEVPVMPKWPQMCGTCDDVLIELYRLHQQMLTVQRLIQKQTKVAREIVVKTMRPPTTSILSLTPPSTARNDFLTSITSDLTKDEACAVKKLIDHLHNKIIVEASHTDGMIFPSWSPPDGPKNTGPTSQLLTLGSQSHTTSIDPHSTTTVTTPSSSTGATVTSISASNFSPAPRNPIPKTSFPCNKFMQLEPPPLPPLDDIKYADTQDLEDDNSCHISEFEDKDMEELEELNLFLEGDKDDPDFCNPTAEAKDPLSTDSSRMSSTSDSSDDDIDSDNSWKWKRKVKSRPTTVLLSVPVDSQECDLCGEVTPFAEIEDHLKSHNVQDYIAKCPNPACPYVFSCSGKLRTHLRDSNILGTRGSKECRKAANLPPREVVNCEVCCKDCLPYRLVRHCLQHEAVMEKILTCPIQNCTERYALKQCMDEHIKEHDLRPSKTPPKEAEQECSVCKLFIKVKDVAKHIKKVHGVDEIVPCKLCPFQFHDWESLLDHLYEHRILHAGQPCFICDDTEVKFTSSWSLRKHYFNVHQKGKKFICEYCDKEFFGYRDLSSHKLLSHTTDTEKEGQYKRSWSYKCDVCPSIFNRKEMFTAHKIKMHQAPPFTCKFCDKTFTAVKSVKRHVRLEHLGLGAPLTHKCEVESCSQTFKNGRELKRHMRDSHPPEAYTCETCGKLFTKKTNLNTHIRNIHLGLGKKRQRVVCETCGESFAHSSSLRTHKLIHTGERPYSCTICDQAFRHRDVLATHLQAHEKKGDSFKPNGPMKNVRKRVTLQK